MFCPKCGVQMELENSGCTYEIMFCPQCGHREEDIMDPDKIFKEV